LAVTENSNVYLLAVNNKDKSLMVTMSHDGGDTFMPATAVSPTGVNVTSQGENGPSLFARGMSTYALWQQQRRGGGTDVVFASGSGMGKPFNAPVRVTDKPLSDTSFNGFSSMAVAPSGEIYVVWLDGRDQAQPQGTFSLYLAKSSDKGVTFSKNIRVASGVCPCCRPAILVSSRGEIYIAWRKVFDGDIRDIVIARSEDKGLSFREPVRISKDNWELHACPDSGPSLAEYRGRIYAAWYSEGNSKAGVRVASSENHGTEFSSAVIASSNVLDANHPVLTTDGESLMLVFQGRDSHADGGWSHRQAFAAKIDAGTASSPTAIARGAASASYPAVATAGLGRLAIAWTEHGANNSDVYLIRGRLN
jgi:hypothetical protein